MRIKVLPSDVVTIQVQFRIVKRGGRKMMQVPTGAMQQRKPDSTIVKALSRAFRWKQMLQSGGFTTIADLAVYEKIAPTYMSRVLRLNSP